MNHYRNSQFMLSVADLGQLPPDQGIEIAIVGRSNAGKSTVLNKITQNKGLARVSKTPGRTQFINLFSVDAARRLVDVPGYGYAKVPPAVRLKWFENLNLYFQDRDCLKGLILVMDCRHPLQEMDRNLLEAAHEAKLPVHILLNKIDKLNKQEIAKAHLYLEKELQIYGPHLSWQDFSGLKGSGVTELQTKLNHLFSFG